MNWWVYGNMLGMNINVVTLSVAAHQGTAPDPVIHMSVWLYLIQGSLAQASTVKSPSHNDSKQSFISHILSHHPASHKWLELIAVRAKHSGMWCYMCKSPAAEEHQSSWSQHVSKEDWVQLLTPDMFFSWQQIKWFTSTWVIEAVFTCSTTTSLTASDRKVLQSFI